MRAPAPVRRRAPFAALAAAGAVAILSPAPARADDEPASGGGADVDRLWSELEGEIRAGWRFLDDEEDGRFLEDHALRAGPLLFDLTARGTTSDDRLWFEEFEVDAHGIGDEEQDARAALRKPGVLDLRGGWMRDDFSYRATGDPFPYDTVRERYDFRARWTPSRRVAVRLEWDRSRRTGDAYTSQQSFYREPPSPPGVDDQLVLDHRPLDQQSDTLSLGVDLDADGWRFTVEESVTLAQIDDRRDYDVPASLRGPSPLSESFRRDVRSTAWTTLGKVSRGFFDDALELNGIVAWTKAPTESDVDSTSEGYEPGFDPGGIAPRGSFQATTSGENEIDRENVQVRVESIWRAAEDVEIVGAFEKDDTWDDAELRLEERRVYDRPDLGPETTVTSYDARITDRNWRASLEGSWDVTEDVRLRLGEEYLRQQLESPTDTRGDDLAPTDFESAAWRTLAGIDVEPVDRLDLSLLTRFGQNDDPHAAPSPERAEEITFRGRWRADDALTLTTAYRHIGYTHSDDYDASSRTDSGTVAATWTSDRWTVAPTVTYQVADTRTDTTYYATSGGSFSRIDDQVSFATRDLIVSLDVEYAFTRNLRGFLRGTRIEGRGDVEESWDEFELGAEHDLDETFSVGASLRSWRFDEHDATVDDYRVLGAEVWVTLRF